MENIAACIKETLAQYCTVVESEWTHAFLIDSCYSQRLVIQRVKWNDIKKKTSKSIKYFQSEESAVAVSNYKLFRSDHKNRVKTN